MLTNAQAATIMETILLERGFKKKADFGQSYLGEKLWWMRFYYPTEELIIEIEQQYLWEDKDQVGTMEFGGVKIFTLRDAKEAGEYSLDPNDEQFGEKIFTRIYNRGELCPLYKLVKGSFIFFEYPPGHEQYDEFYPKEIGRLSDDPNLNEETLRKYFMEYLDKSLQPVIEGNVRPFYERHNSTARQECNYPLAITYLGLTDEMMLSKNQYKELLKEQCLAYGLKAYRSVFYYRTPELLIVVSKPRDQDRMYPGCVYYQAIYYYMSSDFDTIPIKPSSDHGVPIDERIVCSGNGEFITAWLGAKHTRAALHNLFERAVKTVIEGNPKVMEIIMSHLSQQKEEQEEYRKSRGE